MKKLFTKTFLAASPIDQAKIVDAALADLERRRCGTTRAA